MRRRRRPKWMATALPFDAASKDAIRCMSPRTKGEAMLKAKLFPEMADEMAGLAQHLPRTRP